MTVATAPGIHRAPRGEAPHMILVDHVTGLSYPPTCPACAAQCRRVSRVQAIALHPVAAARDLTVTLTPTSGEDVAPFPAPHPIF